MSGAERSESERMGGKTPPRRNGERTSTLWVCPCCGLTQQVRTMLVGPERRPRYRPLRCCGGPVAVASVQAERLALVPPWLRPWATWACDQVAAGRGLPGRVRRYEAARSRE